MQLTFIILSVFYMKNRKDFMMERRKRTQCKKVWISKQKGITAGEKSLAEILENGCFFCVFVIYLCCIPLTLIGIIISNEERSFYVTSCSCQPLARACK